MNKKSNAPKKKLLTPERILLVEDDDVDQLAFKRMIQTEELNYEAQIAGSVAEAKKVLSENKFDAVIVDYQLGDGTAFDVFDSIDDTPFVILTGEGSEEIATEAIEAGASDYLIKEPNQDHLMMLPSLITKITKNHKTERRFLILAKASMQVVDKFSQLLDGIDKKTINLEQVGQELKTTLDSLKRTHETISMESKESHI